MVRKKEHADTVFTWVRQPKPEPLASILKESMGYLKQDSRTVASIFFTAACTAVIEILQDRQRLFDDFVRFLALDIDHETDATSVVLKPRIIKALFGREVGNFHIPILRWIRPRRPVLFKIDARAAARLKA